MTSNDPEPDRSSPILHVGQDEAGHWLVQEDSGNPEGRFVSFAAAMAFARRERQALPGAAIAASATPLMPTVSFAPAPPWEYAAAQRRAA